MSDYVDIIIVNYNTHAFLKECIASVEKHTDYPYRLLVIDNNSTDGSKIYLKKLEEEGIRVIRNSTNLGCAKAWNQGIKATNGKYLLFLNPDTQMTPHWLQPMVACAESDPQIAVVGNKQVNQHGIILHAGLVLDDTGKAYFRGAGETDTPDKFEQICDCIDVCGACYLVKRDCLTQVGLFDERFFMYAEETDFSHRVRLLGMRVVYCPVTIIHFKDGAPISQTERQRIHLRSCQLFDEKWKGGGI